MASNMADPTVGFATKRLELGQLCPAPADSADLIQALRHPTVDGFNRALDLLHGAAAQRFAAVQESAVEQAEAVGEADARRLKRQFSSLKNTFLHYEVKNEFLAELLDGRPHGDEGDLLQHFEAEVDASLQHLRDLKQSNEQTQAAIGQLVQQIVGLHDAFERQRTAVAGELARLQQDVAQHQRDMGQALPELPEGGDEQQCQEALTAAAAEVRDLESQIAAQLAEAQELESAIASEKEEAEVLRVQLAELEGQAVVQGERVDTNARFLSTAEWCDEVASTITLLGGLSLLHVARNEVHLKLVTAYPTAAVRGADPGPCATADHELSLHLQPGSGTVCGAQLTPADVEVEDIVEAAREGGRRSDFVVREVQARLGAWLHRRALVEEAGVQFELAATSADCSSVRAKLDQGVEAEVRLVAGWPTGIDAVQVTDVSGAADEAKAASLLQLRLEGRGLLQGLEAVQREVAVVAP